MVTDAAIAILVHQLLYQGMFLGKNVVLRRRLAVPIRGRNPEASRSILFFGCFIILSLWLARADPAPGSYRLLGDAYAWIIGLALMGISLLVALASLRDLGDSWRVGVIEEQRTELVETGIYRYSRNPYFLAYLTMFAAYTVLLQNGVLLVLSLVGFVLIHRMVLREEAYLARVHPGDYPAYCRRVPRYLLA